MHEIPFFQVDAFTEMPLAGNPAAVMFLEHWLPDTQLQAIASENNLSETAFVVTTAEGYELRWFTPKVEVDLCGHATLAAAHVLLYEHGAADPDRPVRFHTRSGDLTVTRTGSRLELDFPARPPKPVAQAPAALLDGLGVPASAVLAADDYLVEVADEATLLAVKPRYTRWLELDRRGVIVTAAGTGAVDFVSRFFAPKAGIGEDPVTGSAHCTLAPYWAGKLGKTRLLGAQRSARGGEIACELLRERVLLRGHAVVVLRGEFTLPVAR